MILCVGLNPAIDVTYRVATMRAGQSHRVGQVLSRAGGKAVNVARGVQAQGLPVTLVLPLGGPAGAAVAADLARCSLPVHRLVAAGETRRTVTVVDDLGEATAFNEAGSAIGAADWEALKAAVAHHCRGIEVVVLSGSTPPGVPSDGYAQLTRIVRSAGAEVIVDCSGDQLPTALDAGPTMVKPNGHELAQATGGLSGLAGARALQAASSRTAVVASLGSAGMVAVAADGAWQARSPKVLRGNPTGAGDAAVAALAAAVHRGVVTGESMDWPSVLRSAVALSASAVLQPMAGEVDLVVAAELADHVQVEALGPTRRP